MNKQQKEWQKYVDEIYEDYNRQRRELISRCFWTGYYSGSQNRIGITATDISKMMKETDDFKKLKRKLRDVEDLLGFIITELENRPRNNSDIRIKPPR